VLGLMCLGQAGLARRFDAEKDLVEIGITQQAQQFLVSDDVNTGLGIERQGSALSGVPPGQGLQKLSGIGAMPDKIIVGEKNHGNTGSSPGFYLAQHLVDRFEAHFTAEDDNDVAELAAERTASGTLDNSVRVTTSHEVQARRGRIG